MTPDAHPELHPDVYPVRHFLAALAYRFQKAVRDAPGDFARFEAGSGVRPPLGIVRHMNGVLGYARVVLDTGDADHRHRHPDLDWEGEIAALHDTLRAIDARLARGDTDPERLARLLQGPLSDAMTHVGQLALLRRLAGSAVRGENFYMADVRAGRVGADQPDPVAPDER